ncbi:thiamin pyrophosphokinase 1-like isoform X2 [Amphibalanus amphitrite]|nr:thiamin pyrophosphokinase 1-like isoform X2 [Amphibalanus amphitrite]XP_043224153.1 thiamin pyrophosphokinase 1-like isoform X2 [Amphibalanus amphitrite]
MSTNDAEKTARVWRPVEVLTYLGAPGGAEYACLLLNRPVDGREVEVSRVWNRASLRLSVDGGTNVLRKLIEDRDKLALEAAKLPDFITGDFDSITDETRAFFSGCRFIATPDQDETDFTKALRVAAERGPAHLAWVTVVAENTGRIDQVLANINTLFTARTLLAAPVYLLAAESLSFLLPPGRHEIHLPPELRSDWCSLVPVGAPAAAVTTSGLQWDLAGQPMAFGQLISTSNRPVSELVTVDTSEPLLFSVALP